MSGIASLQALDPATPIHQYTRDLWDQQQGLTGSAIYGIYQLADGYLWLNTSAGLLRFDGVRFVPAPHEIAGRPITDIIQAVGEAPGGTLLLRGMSVTLTLANEQLREALSPAPLPDGHVRVVHQSRDGTIWIGADNQIYRAREGRLALVADDVSWTNAIMEAGDTTWIAANSGIYGFAEKGVRYFPAKGYQRRPAFHLPAEIAPVQPDAPGNCTGLLSDNDGGLWVASVDGLWHWKDNRFFQDDAARACGSISIYCLTRDHDGNIWAGTDGAGLWRLAHSRWTQFSARNGLIDDSVLCLREDREGSLWVGTRAGLTRFRDAPFRTLTTEDGLSSDNVWSVIEARDGSVYASTANAGVTRFSQGSVTWFTASDGLPRDAGGALFEDAKGRIWASTDQGLGCVENGRAHTYTGGGKLPGFYVPALAEDASGLILARGDRRLFHFANDELQPFDVPVTPEIGGTPARYVWQMLRDNDGVLWLAMTAGLYRLDPGDPASHTRPTAVHDLINSLSDDGRGFLWLAGTNTPGFTRYDKRRDRVVRYTPGVGATVDGIGRILADEGGNLWMNTPSGIARFARSELDAFADGRLAHLHCEMFGTLDGLKTQECGLVGPQPAAWRGNSGRMYFASRKGIVTLDPKHIVHNALPPQVRIEELLLDGQRRRVGDRGVIPAGAERIEIRFTALSFRVPTRVAFRYQLEGYDRTWVDAGSRRSAFYTRLPPGKYRFHVIACNDDGVWNTEGATLTLSQLPSFRQTWWFALLVAGALIAAAALAYSLRIRQLRKREAALSRLVDERTTALRKEVHERMVAEQALMDHRAHLERTVEERTAQLQHANRKLQQEMREHQESEQRLRQAQKLESIGLLAGGVAHDFNNILTVIRCCCDLWLDAAPAGDSSREHADEIKRAAERASALTHQLLAFSRKQMLKPERVDLNGLLADMEKMLRRLLREDIEFLTKLDARPCLIHVDPGQLGQVVLNLAVNARDAMPNGGRLVVETTWVQADEDFRAARPDVAPGSYAQLTVTDSGVGMDAATLSRVFEPFFTTKELGKGTGLGLSTVFGIIKQSGGHICATSTPGAGTSFRILLPRYDGTSSGSRPAVPIPGAAGHGETILIAEDQPEVRGPVAAILTRNGYRVLTAASGLEALALASAPGTPIDVLFTDLVMPGLSGRELAKRLHEMRPDVRVVFTSGYAADAGWLEQGPPILAKPFSADQLLAAIAAVLGKTS